MNQAVHITPMNRSARALDAVAAAEDPSSQRASDSSLIDWRNC